MPLVRRVLGVAFAVALMAPLARAGESGRDLAGLSLEELLDVNVVSATRLPESRETAPATVWVVTREEIERLGLRDLKEILALVPGVDAIDPHFFLLGGQRGFIGSFSQSLLLVNGREMNNLIAGETFISNQFRAHNIERVEVMNGPGSALYGANALGGVINIITRSESGLAGTAAEVAYGSFGTTDVGVIVAQPAGDPPPLRVALSWYRTSGDDFSEFLSATGRASPSAENNPYRHRPDAYGYSNDSEAIYASLAGTHRGFYAGAELYRNDSGRGTSGIQWDYLRGSDHRDLVLGYAGYQFEPMLASRLNLRAEYRYYWEQFWGDHTETEGPLVDPATGEEITEGATRDDVERFRGYYSNKAGDGSVRQVALVDGSFLSGDLVNLAGGVSFEHSDILAARFARGEGMHPAPGPDETRPEYENTKWGIYLQEQMKLWDGRVIATIGARYDEHERYGGSFNPRVGVVVRPFGGTTLKLLYGEGFREPNVFELQNSESIRPTNLRTFEAGWRQRLGPNVANELVAFRNRADDLIVTDEIVVGGISNKGELDSHGVENVLSYKRRALHGALSYTYTTAELDQPQTGRARVYDIPRHKAALTVIWHTEQGYSAGCVLRYRGNVETTYHDDVYRVPDYLVADLTAGWSPQAPRFPAEVQLLVRNLFDSQYFHPEPRAPSVVMHPQDGQSIELRLRWKSAK